MKKVNLKTGAIAIGVVVIVLLIMPDSRMAALRDIWLNVTQRDASACMNYERKQLSDPDAAELISSGKTKDGWITINYRAKNAYGAYVTVEAGCVIKGGAVNDTQTQWRRSTDDAQRLLDKQIDCLDQKRLLRSQGIRESEMNSRIASCR